MRILLLFMLMVLLAVEPLGAAAPITAAAWTPDGQQVVLGSQGGIEVRTWPRLQTVRTLATELEHVHDLRFSPDGQRLLAAGGSPAVEGAVEVLSWPDGKRLLKVAGHDDLVYRAAWSSAGTEWATAAADGSCQVFAADTGKQLARYTGHARAVLSLCYLPDNTTIASVGVDQTVRLWESATGKHLRTLDNHVDTVNDVAVRPGGNEPAMVVVATISEDRTVRLWQPSIGRLLRFARLPSAPRALAWSATGELLYVGCNDGYVRTLDPDSMEVVHDSNGLSPGRIHELLLSAADGQLLVAGESGCRLVDVKSEGSPCMKDAVPHSARNAAPTALRRELGVVGATMMGLGSIIGTGVFVSIGIAAGVAGPAVIVAIALAALVAICNGLSSAQLAANHPQSGGSYEYGYRWLHPSLGFTAGWMFLCAKTASAATAALGFSAYLLGAIGRQDSDWLVPLALGAVLVLTVLALSGMGRSAKVNLIMVGVTLLSLIGFVMAGLPTVVAAGTRHLTPFFSSTADPSSAIAGVLQACALMFVAYTGYGRIATLAEEVHDPRRTIPRAIIVTLLISMLLYMAVGIVAVAAVGTEAFSSAGSRNAAPLEFVARRFSVPGVARIVAIGAVTAMLGVLLNLILGLSRVVLAMARRRDVPTGLAQVSSATGTPQMAVILIGVLIAGLVMLGDVKTTWSFSAFSVLIYYAITNLAAIRMSPDERLYSPIIPAIGLLSCLFLAFWVEPYVWMIGLTLIGGGLIWHVIAGRLKT